MKLEVFMVLIYLIQANPDDLKYLKPEQFQEQARTWGQNFRLATFDEVNFPVIYYNISII